MKILTTCLLLLGTNIAQAIPCDPPPAKPHKARPKKAKPKTPPPVVKPCDCPPGKDGKDGLDGADGRDGRDGKNSVMTVRYPGNRGVSLRVGVMGVVYTPHDDWAWGPALQLTQPVGARGEFVVDAGLALPADGWVGNEQGLLLHAGYTRYVTKRLGLTLGVHSTSIAGSTSNNNISADYLGVNAGIVLRNRRVRVELSPVFSGLRDDSEPGTQFTLGFAGSAFLSF